MEYVRNSSLIFNYLGGSDKHSSSPWAYLITAVKSIQPPGLYFKTLQICNLQEMDKFCCKLVSFTYLDKRASLLRNLSLFRKLQTRNVLKYRPQIQHYDTQHNDIQHNNIQHNDIQHNDIQHNDTQYKGLISDIQHNNTLPLC